MDREPAVSSVPSAAEPQGRQLSLLCLGALGVVYGDIGTSPLYAVRECFTGPHAIEAARLNILGILSLIFWALVLIISIKYLVFILRADNRGEGGILSLTALVMPLRAAARTRPGFIVVLGLFGAALLYADGIITPAISVLSAVEGLSVAAPGIFDPYVELFTIVILVGLFLFQPRGTARVGVVFGPVLVVWFLTLAVLGIGNLLRAPDVLKAVSPHYAMEFFWHNGWQAFLTLGAHRPGPSGACRSDSARRHPRCSLGRGTSNGGATAAGHSVGRGSARRSVGNVLHPHGVRRPAAH